MLLRGFVRLSAFASVLALGCSVVEARLSPPSNITPTGVSSTAIEITWSDSNKNVVGFWIERSQPGRKRRFKRIATINDGSARSFVDTGLLSGTTYYYSLRTLQEKRSRSGKLRKPRKSRRSKPASGATIDGNAPTPQLTATARPQPTVTPPPFPGGGSGSPWARGLGARATDIGVAAAVDAGGNVVTTGRFMDRVDFGGGRIASRGGFDVFLAKYAPDGTHLWSRGFGGTGGDNGAAVAVDPAGNIVVTGFFVGTANLGGRSTTSAGEADVFLAKYAPDGTHLWSKSFGGSNTDAGYAVGTDAAGNVIMAGSFYGSVSFGGAPLAASQYSPTDLFVAKYAPDGTHLWSKNFDASGRAIAHGLAVEANGNIALTGLFSGSLDFGGGAITSTNFTADIFVAKLSPTGTPIWSRGFGSSNIDYGTGIAVDRQGDVVVTGVFRHTVDFGGGGLPDSGLGNAFVAKYDGADGTHRWSHHAGSFLETDVGAAVVVDATGNAAVVGRFKSTADFSGTSLTSAGAGDAFLARYSSGGSLLSAERFGGAGDDLANGVAIGRDGSIVATGGFSATAAFRGDVLSSAGGHDAFVVQLVP